MATFIIYVNPQNNEVTWQGVVANKTSFVAVNEKENLIVLRQRGETHNVKSMGIYSSKYFGAGFTVYRYLHHRKIRDDLEEYELENLSGLLSFPIRQPKKEKPVESDSET